MANDAVLPKPVKPMVGVFAVAKPNAAGGAAVLLAVGAKPKPLAGAAVLAPKADGAALVALLVWPASFWIGLVGWNTGCPSAGWPNACCAAGDAEPNGVVKGCMS